MCHIELHQPFQHLRVACVIAFSEPDEVAGSKLDAFVPLLERFARVRVVVYNLRHLRIVSIPLYHLPAVVCRAVVENDHLDILIGLS